MTTAVDIVLADAQATPVNHTFSALGLDANRVCQFVDRSAIAAIGYWTVSVDITNPPPANPGQSSKNRVRRVKITLAEPALETLGTNDAGYTPAPTVAYIPRVIIEFVQPEQMIMQSKKDVRKMAYTLLNNAQIIAVVEDGVSLT